MTAVTLKVYSVLTSAAGFFQEEGFRPDEALLSEEDTGNGGLNNWFCPSPYVQRKRGYSHLQFLEKSLCYVTIDRTK